MDFYPTNCTFQSSQRNLRDVANMPNLVYSEIEFPDTLVDAWSQDPRRTDALLNSEILSRELGDNWLDGTSPPFSESAYSVPSQKPVLQVPSSVIHQEWNYLLNPEHPTYSTITWSETKPFRTDPRLIDLSLR